MGWRYVVNDVSLAQGYEPSCWYGRAYRLPGSNATLYCVVPLNYILRGCQSAFLFPVTIYMKIYNFLFTPNPDKIKWR
jgi:hypothetical protein